GGKGVIKGKGAAQRSTDVRNNGQDGGHGTPQNGKSNTQYPKPQTVEYSQYEHHQETTQKILLADFADRCENFKNILPVLLRKLTDNKVPECILVQQDKKHVYDTNQALNQKSGGGRQSSREIRGWKIYQQSHLGIDPIPDYLRVQVKFIRYKIIDLIDAIAHRLADLGQFRKNRINLDREKVHDTAYSPYND